MGVSRVSGVGGGLEGLGLGGLGLGLGGGAGLGLEGCGLELGGGGRGLGPGGREDELGGLALDVGVGGDGGGGGGLVGGGLCAPPVSRFLAWSSAAKLVEATSSGSTEAGSGGRRAGAASRSPTAAAVSNSKHAAQRSSEATAYGRGCAGIGAQSCATRAREVEARETTPLQAPLRAGARRLCRATIDSALLYSKEAACGRRDGAAKQARAAARPTQPRQLAPQAREV